MNYSSHFIFRVRSHPGFGHVHRMFGTAIRDRYSLRCRNKYSLYPVPCRQTENNRRKTQGNCI